MPNRKASYYTLAEIEVRKDELLTEIRKKNEQINTVWNSLFVPKKVNTKGELVASIISNSVTESYANSNSFYFTIASNIMGKFALGIAYLLVVDSAYWYYCEYYYVCCLLPTRGGSGQAICVNCCYLINIFQI